MREDENELQVRDNSDLHYLVVGLVDYSDSTDRKRRPRVNRKRKVHVDRLLNDQYENRVTVNQAASGRNAPSQLMIHIMDAAGAGKRRKEN